jgi:hypothetical protein
MSGPIDFAAGLLSYLPAFVTSWGAMAAPIAGLAAAVWIRVQLGVAGAWPSRFAFMVGLLVGAVMLGIAAQRSVCDSVRLREEVATLKATIADRELRLAEYQIIVEAGAAREAQALRDIEALQTRKSDYDEDVARAATANPAGVWRFDAARVDRMCRLAPAACRPAGGK